MKRWGVAAGLIVVLPLLVASRCLSGSDLIEGNWVCLVCGESEWRAVDGGEVIETKEVSEEWGGVGELREFAEWYRREIGDAHEHVWRRAGGHRTGRRISCTRFHGDHPWFTLLPRLVDLEVSRHLLRRMRESEGEERTKLLESFNVSAHDETSLWRALRNPATSSAERAALFGGSLEENPT